MLASAARERYLVMPMASQALTLYRLLVTSGKANSTPRSARRSNRAIQSACAFIPFDLLAF